jgi:hypothetical protein
MPYVKEEIKQSLEPELKNLIDKLTPLLSSGIIVYVLYKIVKEVYGHSELGFDLMSEGNKVLDDASREYYRKVMAPYEDGKIEQNGNVEFYSPY